MRLLYETPTLALLAGSLVYCVLAIIASFRYRRSGAPLLAQFPPVSVLRPLAGAEDNTEANLRSLFAQQYPAFEILLSVHEASDPAAEIARRVMAEFPAVSARLVVAGVSPSPNAKVWSLRALIALARHENVVMTDSDIRLESGCLKTLVSELSQPGVGLVTCPYRAAAGASVWSRMEAMGLNTDFLAGMLAQRMLNGMDFAIGCTLATRSAELDDIGGFGHLQHYLAEDFMMGNLMHARGRTVILSRSVIEHHIGSDPFQKNWRHRLRWARSTRRSRPAGYVGEIFTKPVALGLIAWLAMPGAWELFAIALVFRAAVVWCTAIRILNDPLINRCWFLLPFEDIFGFATWSLGFFGKSIVWRGRKLIVLRDGRLKMQAGVAQDSVESESR